MTAEADIVDPTIAQTAPPSRRPPARASAFSKITRWLSPLNISALYLLAVMLIYFSFRIPGLFWTETTLKSLMANQAVSAMVALALVVPLAAGEFDLSVGPVLGVTGILTSDLVVHHNVPWLLGCACGLVFGLIVGAVNALMVVRFRIHSFIATLAVTSILAGVAGSLTNGADIVVPATNEISKIALGNWFGVPKPFWYMVVVALVMWYVLAFTPAGRYLFATGIGSPAARLAGVRTNRYVVGAFLTSGVISAFAGIVTLSNIGSSSASTGPPFVLPAFAAAFVGSTQFKRGQFNVWGTLVAVFVLAIGVHGLILMNFNDYVQNIFNGLALALAVGLASFQTRPPRRNSKTSRKLRNGYRGSKQAHGQVDGTA